MALHLTVLGFLMAFHKDRVWGHCCLPFIPANCLKSSNTIYLKHMPMLMTLSFTCRLVLTRLLIRLMRSLPWNAVYRTFVRGCLRISSNLMMTKLSSCWLVQNSNIPKLNIDSLTVGSIDVALVTVIWISRNRSTKLANLGFSIYTIFGVSESICLRNLHPLL